MPTSESPASVEAFFGRPSRLAADCSQPMQLGQRRLVLDILNIRLIRKKDHAHFHRRFACRSHPQRPEELCARQFLLRAPTRYMPLAALQGTGLSQRGFLAGARTQETSSVCDVTKTEPFGKPAVWMYQF